MVSHQPDMTMRRHRQVFTVAVVLLATPWVAASAADADPADAAVTRVATRQQEPDIDLFALMSGKCSTLKVAGRDFGCRAVAYFHSEQGRASFTIALDDPDDNSHIISFSGDNARREDNLYELPIDRMLLNSNSRPRADGLPVPSSEASTGLCRQVGNFATAKISSIACNATDQSGKRYELQFDSDGSPMTVRRIIQSPPSLEKHRIRQNLQIKCRNLANQAKVLPRDLTTYIIRCLAEDNPMPPEDGKQ
jgi:hypothetical protein